MNIPEIDYNAVPIEWKISHEMEVDRRCNGFIAVNKGDVLVRINGFPLLPYPPGHPELSGESMTVGGNLGEIYRGRIQIVFPAPAPGQSPSVWIIQKFYLCD